MEWTEQQNQHFCRSVMWLILRTNCARCNWPWQCWTISTRFKWGAYELYSGPNTEHSYYSRKPGSLRRNGHSLQQWCKYQHMVQDFISPHHLDKPKRVKQIGECIMSQQNKTLGHVIRCSREDPMRQMTINDNLQVPGVYTRRVGRPRVDSIVDNSKWVFEEEHPTDNYDHTSEDHRNWVAQQTRERIF